MNRGASAAFLAELAAAAHATCHLVSVATSDGTSFMTDYGRSLSWGGNQWLATCWLLGFSDIEEAASLQVSKINISLSGVDQVHVAGFLSGRYIDRTVRIYKAFLDGSDSIIADPVLIFEGRIDSPSIEEDPESGKSTVAVAVADHWVDFERKSGRHTNHAEQQLHFPGDKGFEFCQDVENNICWGGDGRIAEASTAAEYLEHEDPQYYRML